MDSVSSVDHTFPLIFKRRLLKDVGQGAKMDAEIIGVQFVGMSLMPE